MSAIEQKAADWLVLRDHGFTPAQREEFATWLRADDRHGDVYAELEQTWDLLDRIDEVAPAAWEEPEVVAAPLKPLGNTPEPAGKFAWFATVLTAAAAVALVGLALWQPAADPAEPFSLTASTEIGELRKLTLPDGSVVQLNTDSTLTVQFTAAERRVGLTRGEAHFQVMKNPARPFIVSAGAVAVRAVGTAFDVRLRPQAIEVLVTEGKVRVDDTVGGKSLLAATSTEQSEPLLLAGQRVLIPIGGAVAAATAGVVAVPSAEMGQALAWQERRLEFVAAPLEEIVAEFNRYNRHKLVIGDPRLAPRRFGGTFPAGDGEELVKLLVSDFGVIAERGENETTLRLAP